MSEEELREYCKEASLEICNMQHTIDKQKEVLDKIKEILKKHIRKDGFLELNEWQTRDILELLEEIE